MIGLMNRGGIERIGPSRFNFCKPHEIAKIALTKTEALSESVGPPAGLFS